MTTTNGLWQGDNPLDYSLPLFILQLTMVVCATRFFVFILKPLHQPRVIAEILVTSFLFQLLFFIIYCLSSNFGKMHANQPNLIYINSWL